MINGLELCPNLFFLHLHPHLLPIRRDLDPAHPVGAQEGDALQGVQHGLGRHAIRVAGRHAEYHHLRAQGRYHPAGAARRGRLLECLQESEIWQQRGSKNPQDIDYGADEHQFGHFLPECCPDQRLGINHPQRHAEQPKTEKACSAAQEYPRQRVNR